MQFIRLTCDNVVLKTRKTQLRLLEFSTDSVLNNRKPMEGWRVFHRVECSYEVEGLCLVGYSDLMIARKGTALQP